MEEEYYEYKLSHRFQEIVIVPYCAISQNLHFLTMKNKDKYVVCADGVRCKVVQWEEKSIIELESDIRKYYNIDAWSFLLKWHRFNKNMAYITFVKIVLNKCNE